MEIFSPLEIKEKCPQGRQPKHSVSFREKVAKKILEEGMSYREAAKNFCLSHWSIANITKNHRNGKMNAKRREYTAGLD